MGMKWVHWPEQHHRLGSQDRSGCRVGANQVGLQTEDADLILGHRKTLAAYGLQRRHHHLLENERAVHALLEQPDPITSFQCYRQLG